MNVTYKAKTDQRPEESVLLQEATRNLEEVLGAAVGRVTAVWDRGLDERGRTVYTLTLADSGEQASALLTPNELRFPRQLRSRLRDLWDDLLAIRSHKLLRALTESSGQAEEGHGAQVRRRED